MTSCNEQSWHGVPAFMCDEPTTEARTIRQGAETIFRLKPLSSLVAEAGLAALAHPVSEIANEMKTITT
jgi:hypothetical protein